MSGKPFFVQERPGKNERIFKIIKFRSMNEKKDSNGHLLPDDKRLTKYGNFIRKTSLDELPEFFNILIGHMSFIGPRPLLVEYLPWYTDQEKHRHDVRPGLTGYAQIHGRNLVDWDKRFELDLQYVNNITFFNDVKICLMTVWKVFSRSDIQIDGKECSEGNMAEIRREKRNAQSN